MSHKIDSATYTTSEKVVGTWIDGKTIYRKTISFGALPNSTEKSVAHSVSNMSTLIAHDTIAVTAAGTRISLPFADPQGITSCIAYIVDTSNIRIRSGVDRSNYASCHSTIWYTKD